MVIKEEGGEVFFGRAGDSEGVGGELPWIPGAPVLHSGPGFRHTQTQTQTQRIPDNEMKQYPQNPALFTDICTHIGRRMIYLLFIPSYTTCLLPSLFVSRCLATKISNANSRLREGCGLVESSLMMRGEQQLTSLLQPLNWGAFDHASHAPQLSGCNYYMHALYDIKGEGLHQR